MNGLSGVLDRSEALSASRLLFFATVLYGGALLWLAPYPPMVDLPQHAGQVVLLRDLLLGRSHWQSDLRLNFFTPYLAGYGLAMLLSLFMPVLVAMKLLLTLGFYGFVAACVRMRRHFAGDPRLDWLFLPAYFGFSYKWGFFTFLIAAPLGILFLLLAHRHAMQPRPREAVVLTVAGVVLFFSHGLVFVFAAGIGCAMLLAEQRRLAVLQRGLLPYIVLGLFFLFYFAVNRLAEAPITNLDIFEGSWGLHRLRGLVGFILGAARGDGVFVPLALILLVAPFMMGARPAWTSISRWIPLLCVLIIWALVPHYAMKTAFLYERFALFIPAFYALGFSGPAVRSPAPWRGRVARVTELMLIIAIWSFWAMQSLRLADFARESSDFDAVLEAAEPGHRVLSLVFDVASPAAENPVVYVHWPAWYQLRNGGFADFNFAWYTPQIVRFRLDRLPGVAPGFEWSPDSFDWDRNGGSRYRYFFVRHSAPLPEDFFANQECKVEAVKSSGSWTLYERTSCR